jgi:hypothetical protein
MFSYGIQSDCSCILGQSGSYLDELLKDRLEIFKKTIVERVNRLLTL